MFSGIGGFELGLQNSDYEFECVGYSEVDKYAISIYERHFPSHKNFGDATKIRTEDLPDFDLLVGGFPCQAFSIAGQRRGFDDTRGTLFFEIARILRDKRPRYFLLENVRGLLSHDKGKTFKTILEVLSDLGYNVKWQVLNSKDFGVPQRRERVYIEGYLRGECGGEVLSVRENNEESTEAVDSSQKLIVEQIKKPVLKRKHEVDIKKLKTFLRDAKNESRLSIKEIAQHLGIPLTQVAHWFRDDDCFSIPPKENWYQLKELLGIADDTFDKSITEFEVVEGKYEMTNRVYSDEGLSPTLTCSGNARLIKEHKRNTIQLNTKYKTYQDGRIYSHNGLSIAMNARGNNGWYTTSDEDEEDIKKHYSKEL